MSVLLSYHNTSLTKEDLELLQDKQWLNDKLIGFAFEYFEYEQFRNHSDTICFVSPEVCQFIKLAQDSEVSLFLEPLNLNEKKLIFFAVNDNDSYTTAGGSHWSLLVFERNSSSSSSSTSSSVFYHLDSFGQANMKVARRLSMKVVQYLSGSTDGYRFQASSECPQQQNGYDCGVYVICFTEQICRSYSNNGTVRIPTNTIDALNARKDMKKLIMGKRNCMV